MPEWATAPYPPPNLTLTLPHPRHATLPPCHPAAPQAAELMAEWAPIEVADALELLSPDFKNDEARAAY